MWRKNNEKSREIADLIRTKREEQGKTAKEIAEESGCSIRTLEYWESGKRNPGNVDLISRILEILGESYTLGKESNDKNNK